MSFDEVRDALGIAKFDSPPEHYEVQAKTAEARGDLKSAEAYYWAASFASAGYSRTYMYEDEAHRVQSKREAASVTPPLAA